MSGHSHAPVSASGRHRRPLLIAFFLTLTVLVAEAVVGIITGSLALLSDAAHMLTDAVGIGMALAAAQLAMRPSNARHRTFGWYRLEILAALANSVLLLGVAVYVLVEAIRRFSSPEDIDGVPVLIVATIGLVANVISLRLLRAGSEESLNVRGAYLEVIADTLGSVGAVVAGVVLITTDWPYVDPIVGLAIGVFIVPRTIRLGAQAVRILVQAAPPSMDLDAMAQRLGAISGVVDVHDLHVWTLTSDMEVATAHVMVGGAADTHSVLDQARALLADEYGIDHATLQVEPDDHEGCDEHGW